VATTKQRKPTAKPAKQPAPKRATGDDRWWKLIEESRKGASDPDDQCEQLEDLVGELSLDEIVAFDRFVQERLRDAFRADLWAVAYIMNGGCSDDGFDYFCGWLVGQGRARYEAALANPADAARGLGPDDEPFENESLYYVARNAFEAKAGEGSYDAVDPGVERTLVGEMFDEETVDELHPALAKQFGGGG
jgi:Protein of unknown function (DUF4240)